MNASLINSKAVRVRTLELAKQRAHRFDRVSGDFLCAASRALDEWIRQEVHRHPSVGKTIRP